MYLFFEAPEEVQAFGDEYKRLSRELASYLKPREEKVVIPAQSSLFLALGNARKLYVVRDGVLQCWMNDRLLYCYDEGDLLGLDHAFRLHNGELRTDFAVVTDEYSFSDLEELMHKDAHVARIAGRLCATQCAFFRALAASLLPDRVHYTPDSRVYAPGQTIIEKGKAGDEVYTMIEGQADVVVDGVNVGEITEDEIFGAIAAITGASRNATVVARSQCLVFVLPREMFLELIISRPHTIEKFVRDLASKVTALNDKVVKLTGAPTKAV